MEDLLKRGMENLNKIFHGEKVDKTAFDDIVKYCDTIMTDTAYFDNHKEPEAVLFYAIKMAMVGIYEFSRCVTIMDGPMGLHDYDNLVRKLVLQYAWGNTAELGALLDTMSAFLAVCMSFPKIPHEVLDLKNCMLCRLETDHSLAAEKGRLSGKLCCHIMEPCGSVDLKTYTLGDFDLHANLTTIDSQYTNFSVALEDFKIKADLKIKLQTCKETLDVLNRVTADYELFFWPREVSTYAVGFLRWFAIGLHRRETLLATFLDLPPLEETQNIRNKLMTALEPQNYNGILNFFQYTSLPFFIKYTKQYSMYASRILWFKLLEATGMSCTEIMLLLEKLKDEIIGCAGNDCTKTDDSGILFWVCVNIFLFTKCWPFVGRHQGDDPNDITTDGLYIFGANTIGLVYKSQRFKAPAARLFELLGYYDVLLTKL